MRERFSSLRRLTAVLICWSVAHALNAADFVVTSRDEVLGLTSKIQATQFLTHATFGPTQQEVDALAARMRAIGTVAAASEWIDLQTNEALTPPSRHLETQERMISDDYVHWAISPAGPMDASHAYDPLRFRHYAWWHNVIAGPDQLRQRMAWALAQIFPVNQFGASYNDTDFDATVVNGPVKPKYLGMADYYDIFVRNAFGNYREVLGKVTYHPVMGDWLSYRGNRRPQAGFFPDENFAREVMQLFTIGLYVLDDNGVQQKTLGQPTATYDADDIREYAQVFTGLGYGYGTYAPTNTALNPFSPYSAGTSLNPNASVKYNVPMRMAPRQHDTSTKSLLNGLTLPNPIGPNVQHTETSANAEINAALDGLLAHQSCPPFIARLLIQRLVKSNPSREYIGRVVAAFKGSGGASRGDLKNVVRAILLDPEAWQPIRVQYQRLPVNRFVVSTLGTEDSRVQEPILNYTRYTRFFKAVGAYQKANGGSFGTPILIRNEFRLSSLYNEFEQAPYLMPTVFNFYLPNHQSGEIVNYLPSSRIPNGQVAAPELQLFHSITCNTISNFFRDRVHSGQLVESVQDQSHAGYNFYGVLVSSLASTRTLITYDFSSEQALANSPANVDRLLERLDLYLCGGTLHAQYKATLRNALLQEVAIAGGTGNVSSSEALDIAKAAILGIVTCPSFFITE